MTVKIFYTLFTRLIKSNNILTIFIMPDLKIRFNYLPSRIIIDKFKANVNDSDTLPPIIEGRQFPTKRRMPETLSRFLLSMYEVSSYETPIFRTE